MPRLISDTRRPGKTGKSSKIYESLETHYDPGQPEVGFQAPESPSPLPKLTTTLLPCQDYKPTALRWWFQCFLIICLATFLGLTEYAIQTLMANNREDLVSQLWSRNIENLNGDQQPVPEQKQPSHPVRAPSNATSSQAEAHSGTTTGNDFLALEYPSSTLAAPIYSVTSTSMDSDTMISSTDPSLLFGEPTEGGSFVPMGPYSTTSDLHPLTTEPLDHETPTIAPTQPWPTVSTLTQAITTLTTSGYLTLGKTTATVRSPIPHVESSDLSVGSSTTPVAASPTISSRSSGNAEGGHEITVPLPYTTLSDLLTEKTAYLKTERTSFTLAPMPTTETSAYLKAGRTSLTLASMPTLKPSAADGGYRSFDMTTAAQRLETMFPGGTSVYQTTKTLRSEVHGERVTVIRQTEAWPSSKATLQRTMTDSAGHLSVQTITTDVPAKTSVMETTVTMRPGESLVAVPKLMETTRGGRTQFIQTTYVDPEGRTTVSSYTTVIGGEIILSPHTYFLATSLAPGYTVITIPTAVPTTERGTIEVVHTVFTDAQGHLTTSLYTKSWNGTPTLRTIPIVIATPVPPGDKLVTLSTVIPTTIGGTIKVIKTTSTDSRGQPTTFSYTTIEGGTSTSTAVWTIVPTPTSTSPPNSNGTQGSENVSVVVYGVEFSDYMLGTFLPTILAAMIAYPFKLININARLMQPFHELATAREAQGASAEASMFLRFYDWTGALSLPRSVKLRQPIILISDLLVFGAALLAPIAAETVSVHVPDGCDLGCYGNLGVTVIPGRVLEVLMASMIALLMALLVLLNVFRWKTGVSHDPWGIAGMASLGLSPGIRDKIRKIPFDSGGSIKENMILKVLTGSKYALEEYWIPSSPRSVSPRGYGIVVRTSNGDAEQLVKSGTSGHGKARGSRNEKKKKAQPFALLTWWGRCILLFIFACVLIIATYYETTSIDSGFERFMNSRGFGIRFFFTALGVVIGGCMETFFRSVAIMLPYQQLSKYTLSAERSILLSPPTNAFCGLYSAFRQRSIFLGVVAFTTVLSELILPVTLSHVPFSHLDTYETQLVCAWFSISILALMILVIVISFSINWPHMPVDPRTIAGAMFYVCDSWMLSATEGLATLGKKERDSIMRVQKLRYEFASSEGVNGKERMKVDMRGESGEAAVMLRGEKARYG